MQAQTLPRNRSASAGQAISATGVVLLLALFVLVTYTVLHEGGHALAGLLFGGTVTELSLNFLNLSAHVGIEGEFSTVQNCVIAAAGVSLPLLVWAGCISAAPRRSNMVVEFTKLIASVAVISTLLAWIVIPILYMNGGRPGDDSVNFLNYSALPPLAVMGVALLLYIGGWVFYFRRIDGLNGLRDLVFRLRFQTSELFAPTARKALLMLVLCGSVVAVSSWALSSYLAAINPLGLPAGYSQAATIDLKERDYSGESIYRFNVDQQATAAFYIVLQDVRSGPIDISLVGPAGYHNTFLRFGASAWEGQGIGRAKVHPTDLTLQSGEYQLKLTVPEGPGQIVVATKIVGAQRQAGSP